MDQQPVTLSPALPAEPPITRNTLISVFVLVVLFIFSLMLKGLILGGATYVSLGSAPALTGVVSQSMLTNKSTFAYVGGTDYTFSASFFDNGAWAVGLMAPENKLSQNINPGTMVFEKIDGMYQIVMGPTSAIPNTQLLTMPADVANYVKNHVAVYTPVPD